MDSPTEISQKDLATQVAQLDAKLTEFIEREEKRKHWKDVVIPLLSLVVALSGIISAAFIQFASLQSQVSLKQYEVTYLAKQKAYSEVLSSMHSAFYSSVPQSKAEMLRAFDKLTTDVFSIQPFLRPAEQVMLNDDVQELIALCLKRYQLVEAGKDDLDNWAGSFVDQKEKVRQRLSMWLFKDLRLN
jgi:hypothetical protein